MFLPYLGIFIFRFLGNLTLRVTDFEKKSDALKREREIKARKSKKYIESLIKK
jgi:predicted GIY-YIG superfamily endonuclease